MRELDRRTPINRRLFMKGAASVAPIAALAAGGTAVSLDAAWADNAKALEAHTLKTMVRMARDIYPHDHLADLYYQNAIMPWDAKAVSDPATRALLGDGVRKLDEAAKAKHDGPYLAVGWESDRLALLTAIQDGDFFQKVRADLVVSLYNQKELWRKFGYEGSSAEHGGYLTRGFDDIDWLDKA